MGNHIQTKSPQNNIPTQFIEARNYIYLFFGTLFDDEEIYIFRFYPRWRDWELQQALELDYTLDEAQLAEDWASLLTLASQPGSSLEQLHIFVLAHVLRRPILIYGVKYVKSWRGENLGYARFEGK